MRAAKRTFQTLPRHLRRRSMSHNIFRIPPRLRDQAMKEMKDTKAVQKAHRRWKRRPHYILRDYVRRQKTHMWLETHIWHAKRMKMAHHSREKSIKASHRAAQHKCTIYDASYHCVLQLSGSVEALCNALSAHLPASPHHVTDAAFTGGGVCEQTLFYRANEYPAGEIGPVSVLWRPAVPNKSERQVWVVVHAAAAADVESVLRQHADIQLMSHRNSLIQFELTGPKSLSVLSSVVGSAPSDAGAAYWQWVNKEGVWPADRCVALSCADPRTRFPPSRTPVAFPSAAPVRWTPAIAESPLWDIHSQLEALQPRVRQHEINQQRAAGEMVDAQQVPLMVVRREGVAIGEKNRDKYGGGFLLIVPAGWALAFWRSLVFVGARAVGMREFLHVRYEMGLPSFPYDYPTTPAYAAWAAAYEAEFVASDARKPLSKRVNHKVLRVSHPYRAPWGELVGRSPAFVSHTASAAAHLAPRKAPQRAHWQPRTEVVPRVQLTVRDECALVPVVVTLLRGVPAWNAMLCIPSDADLAEWASGAEPSPTDTADMPRPVIGHVTSADLSFARGRGFALGFVAASGLSRLLEASRQQYGLRFLTC